MAQNDQNRLKHGEMYFLEKLRKCFTWNFFSKLEKNFENLKKKISPKVIELIKCGEKCLAEKLRDFFDWVILESPIFEVVFQ